MTIFEKKLFSLFKKNYFYKLLFFHFFFIFLTSVLSGIFQKDGILCPLKRHSLVRCMENYMNNCGLLKRFSVYYEY